MSAELSSIELGDSRAIPVSFAQQRLIFIDEFEGGSAAYNISFCLAIQECSNRLEEALKYAVRSLLGRHPALRTLLKKAQNGERVQFVLDETEALNLLQITEVTVENEAELDKILIDRVEAIFELDKDLPIRVGLFRCVNTPSKIYLDVIVHHSCFDGWSWNIFQQELREFVCNTNATNLPKLQASYAHFTVWQRQQLSENRVLQLAEFWQKYVSGAETAQLPLDKMRPARFDYLGQEIDFRIDENTTKTLKELAKSCRVSLYSVLLAAYCLMINAFTSQKDMLIGTPSTNRGQPEFANVIGFFANLLVLRIKIDHMSTLKEYISLVGAAVIQAQIHNEMPFEELIRCLNAPNDTSRNPIAQIIFTLQDVPRLEELVDTTRMLEIKPYRPNNFGQTMTKFDVTTTLTEIEGGLTGNFTYASSLFDECNIRQFIFTFEHILKEIYN